QSGTWENDTGIVVDIDGLDLGVHTIIITINDTSGNFETDEVTITVFDDTPPDVSSPPNDFTYSINTTSNTITWIPTDTNPHKYIIKQNTTTNTTGVWSSGTPIVFSVDGLDIGVYNFSIILNDTSNNVHTDWVIVTVNDLAGPGITSPTDVAFDIENNPKELTWIANDPFPHMYYITQDGVEVQNGTWNSNEEITFLADALGLGVYEFIIYVNDTTGNVSNDTVSVTIRNIDIDNPDDIIYSEGSSPHFITWNATDGNPDYYFITRDGVEVQNGTWVSGVGITVPVHGLSVGIYTYVITINDTIGNSVPDTVIVTVVDATIPEIDDPADFTYEMGSTSNTISWNATDTYPHMYVITRDGLEVQNGTWTSGALININVDSLSLGVYVFVITVNDTTNNVETNTVIVTVEDTTAPSFAQPETVVYEELDTDIFIFWDAYDLNPDNFSVYKDGVPYSSGTWNNTDDIEVNVTGFTLGIYIFELIIEDVSGNTNSSIVKVSVVEYTKPTFSSTSPATGQGNETTTVTLSWIATDLHPGEYVLLLNGTPHSTGTWTDLENITISIDGLTKGHYNLTAVFYDFYNNTVIHTTSYDVIDEKDPKFRAVQSDCEVDEGFNCDFSEFTLKSWWWTDEAYMSHYIVLVNGSADPSQIWDDDEIFYDVSSFDYGFYNITIQIFDESGNFASSSMNVTVKDITLPTFSGIPSNNQLINESS
ncbi:MAG: hypothetical protein ACW99Q_27425, partial [Candidatus Kariarchaeaceae archaeon]